MEDGAGTEGQERPEIRSRRTRPVAASRGLARVLLILVVFNLLAVVLGLILGSSDPHGWLIVAIPGIAIDAILLLVFFGFLFWWLHPLGRGVLLVALAGGGLFLWIQQQPNTGACVRAGRSIVDALSAQLYEGLTVSDVWMAPTGESDVWAVAAMIYDGRPEDEARGSFPYVWYPGPVFGVWATTTAPDSPAVRGDLYPIGLEARFIDYPLNNSTAPIPGPFVYLSMGDRGAEGAYLCSKGDV